MESLDTTHLHFRICIGFLFFLQGAKPGSIILSILFTFKPPAEPGSGTGSHLPQLLGTDWKEKKSERDTGQKSHYGSKNQSIITANELARIKFANYNLQEKESFKPSVKSRESDSLSNSNWETVLY